LKQKDILEQNLVQFKEEVKAKQEELDMEKSAKTSFMTEIKENKEQLQAANAILEQQIGTLKV
jgi:hypothetical protein